MPRVVCRIPTATSPINGIVFAPAADGALVSEEIDSAEAEHLASIPGFEVLAEAPPDPAPAPATKRGKSKGAEPA